MLEMLFQSHLPGTAIFLPALPKQFRPYGIDWTWVIFPSLYPSFTSGKVRSLVSRGDYSVSFIWSNARVTVSSLTFNEWHPWLSPLGEYTRGFFSTRRATSETSVTSTLACILPNKVRVLRSTALVGSSVPCARSIAFDGFSSIWKSAAKTEDFGLKLGVQGYPCQVILCDESLTDQRCEKELKSLVGWKKKRLFQPFTFAFVCCSRI